MTATVIKFPQPAAPDWLKSVTLADLGDTLRIVGTARTIHGQLTALAIRGACPNVRELT